MTTEFTPEAVLTHLERSYFPKTLSEVAGDFNRPMGPTEVYLAILLVEDKIEIFYHEVRDTTVYAAKGNPHLPGGSRHLTTHKPDADMAREFVRCYCRDKPA